MPTYGPQLQAFREYKNQAVDVSPIYDGYDARQQRHDASQAAYATHVDDIMKTPSLDPVEKEKRLDNLRNEFFSLNEKYQGNLSDARDDIMDTITQNRKDPYWSMDEARAKSYNNTMKNAQAMAAQGQSALYQDSQGNYITDLDSVYGSLKDAQGNYKDPRSFDVHATKQLDYEAPLRQAFGSIKANISNYMGKPVTDGEVAEMMGSYIKTGNTKTNNPNIDRAFAGVMENYMSTPEWKQMRGVYGEGASNVLQNMAGNVANQYRFTQNKEQYNFAPKDSAGGGSNRDKKKQSILWDRERKPVMPTNDKGVLNIDKFTDAEGKATTFDKKYSTLNGLMVNGVLNADDLKKQLKEVITPENPEAPIRNRNESKKEIIDRIVNSAGNNIEPDLLRNELNNFLDEDISIKDLTRDMNEYKGFIDMYKQIAPELNSMSNQELSSVINQNIDTGDADIVHTFPNSAITSLGGEGLFTGKEDDASNWKGKSVYYRDKGSNTWEKMDELDKDIYNDVRKNKEETNIMLDSKKGAGYYAEGDKYQVLITAPAGMNRYLKPVQDLESDEKALRSTSNRDLFKVQSNNEEGNTAMIRTLNGPKMILFGDLDASEIKTKLQKHYDDGLTSKDIEEIYQSALYSVDSYNAFLKQKRKPSEFVGNSKN